MILEDLLARIPEAHADLEAAMIPAATHRGDGGTRGDALNRPAPARLEVIEHRHLLLRGLRWWVDAVGNESRARVGQSVPAMCRYLATVLDVMDPEDRTTMHTQLDQWYGGALEYRGAMDTRVDLPPDATAQQVRVADAARILGCTVRTIQRRVPAARRPGGMVLLADAMGGRCPTCDLLLDAGCACTVRTVSVMVAH